MNIEKFAEKTILIGGISVFAIISILYIASNCAYILFWLLLLPLYFVPSIVARKKKHKYRLQIYLLNILLGFTYVGWVLSLIWATINDKNTLEQDS